MTTPTLLRVDSEPWAVIEATDATSRVVCEGVETLYCDVPVGVYRVTAYGPNCSERLVIDLAYETIPRRLSMTYDSPAPFTNTVSGRRYQTDGAYEIRLPGENPTHKLTHIGVRVEKVTTGLLVFVRDPIRLLDPAGLSLRVMSLEGDQLADIRDGYHEPHHGWTALMLSLEPGAYVLTTDDGPLGAYSQVIHVIPNNLTELYAIWRGYIDLASASTFIGAGSHSAFKLFGVDPTESSSTRVLRLDSAEQFAARGEWKRVASLMSHWGEPAPSPSSDLANCLGLYAQLLLGRSKLELPSHFSHVPVSKHIPDVYLLRALSRPPANGKEGTRRDWDAATSSVPAFAAGTRLLLRESRRRTEIAPPFESYLPDLLERFIAGGLWTRWHGTEPLRRRKLSADFRLVQEALRAPGNRPRTAGELAAETAQLAAAVASELDDKAISREKLDEQISSDFSKQILSAWKIVLEWVRLGREDPVSDIIKTILAVPSSIARRLSTAFLHPYRREIVWEETPKVGRQYYIKTVWFDGLPLYYIAFCVIAIVFIFMLLMLSVVRQLQP